MSKQKVKLGKTIDGKPGLFTNGVLAYPLSKIEYDYAKENRDWLERMVKFIGFELEEQ